MEELPHIEKNPRIKSILQDLFDLVCEIKSTLDTSKKEVIFKKLKCFYELTKKGMEEVELIHFDLYSEHTNSFKETDGRYLGKVLDVLKANSFLNLSLEMELDLAEGIEEIFIFLDRIELLSEISNDRDDFFNILYEIFLDLDQHFGLHYENLNIK